jgi:argininosuccinate lyase
MEHIIGLGVPQRTAHHAVGALVAKAGSRPLGELALVDFKEACPDLDEGVYEILGPQRAVEAFQSYGSTAPGQVAKQIAAWQQKLADI